MHLFSFQFLVRNIWVSLLINKNLKPSIEFSSFDKKPVLDKSAAPSQIDFEKNHKIEPLEDILKPSRMGGKSYDNSIPLLEAGKFAPKIVRRQEKFVSEIPPNMTKVDSTLHKKKPIISHCRHSYGQNVTINPDRSGSGQNLPSNSRSGQERDYLICRATGTPRPSVTWFYNNQMTETAFEKIMDEKTVESSLRFPLEFLSLGGNYSFNATNEFGTTTQEFYLSLM